MAKAKKAVKVPTRPTLSELIMEINDNVEELTTELEKAETVKSAAARARKLTLVLTKQFKQFRADSVQHFKK